MLYCLAPYFFLYFTFIIYKARGASGNATRDDGKLHVGRLKLSRG